MQFRNVEEEEEEEAVAVVANNEEEVDANDGEVQERNVNMGGGEAESERKGKS